MAKRNVKWGKPTEDRGGKFIRESKCKRFRIVTRRMASGRNGYFNTPAYDPRRADGTRIGRELCDTLAEALDMVESENDPNWEP